MSGGFPVFPEIQQWTDDPGTASYSSAGFRSYQAYTGTPSGTYGAWSQLIASTPFDADGLIVWLPDSASPPSPISIFGHTGKGQRSFNILAIVTVSGFRDQINY
jgi:hypothetical protein